MFVILDVHEDMDSIEITEISNFQTKLSFDFKGTI